MFQSSGLLMPSRLAGAEPTPAGGPSRGPAGLAPEFAVPGLARKGARSRPQHLLDLACRAACAPRGGIGLVSPEGGVVEFLTYGMSDDEAAALQHSEALPRLLDFVGRRSRPLRLAPTAAVEAETRRQEGPGAGGPDSEEAVPPSALSLSPSLLASLSACLPGQQGGALLAIPVQGPGRCRGALFLLRPAGQPAFTAADEEAAAPVADWLAEGSLFEEARLLTQMRLLNQVAQAAAGNLDLAPIFGATLRELDRQLPLNVNAVWLVSGDGRSGSRLSLSGAPWPAAPQVVLAATSAEADRVGLAPGRRLAADETPFAGCLRDGEALYAEPGQVGAKAPPGDVLSRSLAARGATSWFAVPLRAGERTVGVLQSVCTRPTGFTGEQIQLLYLTADLLGPAISNCQLYGQLRRAYDELHRAQGQLVQAEKMRALGELAGGMAHEFNNSLCGVLGFLELALWDKGLAAASRGYLDSARTCALDAAETVRRVQDFARQRRDQQPDQVLNVNDLVRQTVELVRHKWESLAHARGTPITVAVETTADAPVLGRPTELREVLTNLIFNAVDAMPSGGTLTLRTWSEAGTICLAVRDTGVGIREADRRRLFEPFFTTKGERGNGLGLSVTFAIVKRHGGDIQVDSVPGQGTTFTVRLPAVATGPAAGGRTVPVADPTVPGRRILVVEDEESVRRFLGACLERLGHRPRLVADAAEARAALEAEAFDVVLTDLGLPGASGEDVARAAAARSPAPPVVLLTGWADQLHAEHITVEGVRRVLGKPVTIDTLRLALAEVTRVSKP